MEPFALQSSAPGLIRPTIDLQSDLSAVLREGRVLAGEVLQTLGGGSLLIGVGRHRVPAESQVRMQPGHKFLFQVRAEGGGVVLNVLDEPGTLEPRLLQALRSAAAGNGSFGRLLSELVQALGAELARGGTEASAQGARALAQEVEGHALRPGGSGAGATGASLAQVVSRGGIGYEARLAQAALAGAGPGRVASLGAELAGLLVARLGEGVAGFEASSFAAELRAALVQVLGAEGDALEARLGRWSRGAGPRPELRSLLAAALATLGDGMRPQLEANLGRALPEGLGRGLEGALLRALLGMGAGPGGDAQALLAEAGLDLKGHLLRALSELAEGPARTAVARALEGLENEQLLNLARARSGDALHFSLPVLDGERWATAHLFVKPPGDEGDGRRGSAEGTHRFTLAVDFRYTGPVRAELAVRPGSLAARISVSRPEVLERMEQRRAPLEARLALGGRRVTLALVLAPAEDVRADRELTDIRFLREHRLMDRSG